MAFQIGDKVTIARSGAGWRFWNRSVMDPFVDNSIVYTISEIHDNGRDEDSYYFENIGDGAQVFHWPERSLELAEQPTRFGICYVREGVMGISTINRYFDSQEGAAQYITTTYGNPHEYRGYTFYVFPFRSVWSLSHANV